MNARLEACGHPDKGIRGKAREMPKAEVELG